MNRMTDIMLDIETFGTDSNALVVSISAIKFNLDTGEVGDSFEVGLNLKDQSDAVMDADTIMWWLSQSKNAQEQLNKLEKRPTLAALAEFNSWINDGGPENVPNYAYKLWGNGATFDNVIVRNLYARVGVNFVIPFWNDRCVRTYVDIKGINPKDYEFQGTPHNGLDDCLHQIKYMTGGFEK